MYDITKRKQITTVGGLKTLLENIDDETKLCITGDDDCWFHIEEDESVVNLDCEDLDECYEAVQCQWCREYFDECEGRTERDMGFLCETCIAAIHSRGEKLMFER